MSGFKPNYFHDWPFFQGSTADRLPVAPLRVPLLHLPRQFRYLQRADKAVSGAFAFRKGMRTWAGKVLLFCQLPETRDLQARIRPAVQAPTAALNLTIGTHQCQVTIRSAARCVSCYSSEDWQQLDSSGSLSATSPTPPGDTDPPSVLLSVLARKCLAMPAFFPDELSVINRPRQEPICLGSLAAQHLGLQAPPSTFSF